MAFKTGQISVQNQRNGPRISSSGAHCGIDHDGLQNEPWEVLDCPNWTEHFMKNQPPLPPPRFLLQLVAYWRPEGNLHEYQDGHVMR